LQKIVRDSCVFLKGDPKAQPPALFTLPACLHFLGRMCAAWIAALFFLEGHQLDNVADDKSGESKSHASV